ncbi:hypothetical protein [Corynebacterium heidelbergense]|uniref:hypothetical protein n=1 Tax=Corynebacterium heidelbergense TaxID=2055947 RepID=UPI002359514B|nr:hypothetical protein [Corynebacterium heidelbergense]
MTGNRQHLATAQVCAPDDPEVVISDIATRLADDLLAVPPAHRQQVDTTIATKVLTPTRACQAVPAVRCVHRRVQAIIAEICPPPARPTDTDEVPTPPPSAGTLSIDTRDENTTTFHLSVDKPDAAELTAAITTTAARGDLTTAEALIALIRGQVATSVTGNLPCLCAFHHRVKTSGHWDVTMAGDGTQAWTSHGDGDVIITEPGGPLRRASFTHRATNRARILTERNNQLKPPPDDEPPF